MSLIQKIEHLMLLDISVHFNKIEFCHFEIVLAKEPNYRKSVQLPYDHLNEDKVVKYINHLEEYLLD